MKNRSAYHIRVTYNADQVTYHPSGEGETVRDDAGKKIQTPMTVEHWVIAPAYNEGPWLDAFMRTHYKDREPKWEVTNSHPIDAEVGEVSWR